MGDVASSVLARLKQKKVAGVISCVCKCFVRRNF